MTGKSLRVFLEKKVIQFNQPSFIEEDPVSVPHLFTKKQDIEIAGFFAATFAWGNRKTIIRKSRELMQLMDWAPYQFCLDYTDADLRKIPDFRHRTFNSTDLLYFLAFFQFHYKANKSLEAAFLHGTNQFERLCYFHDYFFSLPFAPRRTRKHVPTPAANSSCKRLNMFLRWMVRNDKKGVDFGIWENISPDELICPIDLHVARVAKKLGLLKRKNPDWKAAEELTSHLFGLGAMEKY
jgi:uncharacterized protein (TIGR02757 family)